MISACPDAAVVQALDARDLLDLARQVCASRGVTLNELCSRVRYQGVSRARHEFWWLLLHHPDRFYSLSDIARLFQRDHTTVLAGVRAHESRIAHVRTPPFD